MRSVAQYSQRGSRLLHGSLFLSSFRWCHSNNSNNDATTTTLDKELKRSLQECGVLLTRAYPVGEFYQRLSPETKTFLTKKLQKPFELFLREYPDHFVIYRMNSSPSGRRGSVIHVCPPYLVPAGVKILSGNCPTKEVSPTDPSHKVMVNPDSEFDTGALTPREKLKEVLRYIPEEFCAFQDLGIPYKVKTSCMGYPATSPIEYFRLYPHYFEVQQPSGGKTHIFFVRRSLSLQRHTRQSSPMSPTPPRRG